VLSIPILNVVTNPVRYMKFSQTLKGFSSKTLATRLKQLEKGYILERQAYHEIPPRVEYRLTTKGQELVEYIISLMQWMRKWSKKASLIELLPENKENRIIKCQFLWGSWNHMDSRIRLG